MCHGRDIELVNAAVTAAYAEANLEKLLVEERRRNPEVIACVLGRLRNRGDPRPVELFEWLVERTEPDVETARRLVEA